MVSEHYLRNREKIIARSKEWQKNNPERYRERMRAWARSNPDKLKANSHTRRARLRGNGGRFSAAEWRALKEAYALTCLRCGKREPDIKITPDHVIPIAAGGSNNIDNIQPLCLRCNLWKNARTIDYRTDADAAKRAEELLAPLKGRNRYFVSQQTRDKISSTLSGYKHDADFCAKASVSAKDSWKKRGARSDSSSGIRGVIWDGDSGTWKARVTHDGKRITLGRYAAVEGARRAIEVWKEEVGSI